MAGMLQDIVKSELENLIVERYHHLKSPLAVLARVTNSEGDGNGNYTVSLKILDKNKNDNNDYPEIPFVKTNMKFTEADIAVVILLYGEADPYVLGRWEE